MLIVRKPLWDKTPPAQRMLVPVGRSAGPDGRYDNGAGLIPVLTGSASDDEAEAVSFFVQRDLHGLEDNS